MKRTFLSALADEQLASARTATSGRAALTVYGGQQHALRQTVIALSASRALAEHESPEEATLLVLRGHVRLTAGTETWDGNEGDLVVIPRARHDLTALTDAAVLLTVATRPSSPAHTDEDGSRRD